MGAKPFPHTADEPETAARPVRLWWLVILITSLGFWAALFCALSLLLPRIS